MVYMLQTWACTFGPRSAATRTARSSATTPSPRTSAIARRVTSRPRWCTASVAPTASTGRRWSAWCAASAVCSTPTAARPWPTRLVVTGRSRSRPASNSASSTWRRSCGPGSASARRSKAGWQPTSGGHRTRPRCWRWRRSAWRGRAPSSRAMSAGSIGCGCPRPGISPSTSSIARSTCSPSTAMRSRRRCSGTAPTCSSWTSTWSSTTPPPPGSNATTRTSRPRPGAG